ncbi:MAG: transporter ATP-binding protein [Acidimicrobiaceae bacterium]|jgi:NitT/TauT family transport system ATP-binding protein|nr:transporter ATP-binding protein [Acidimicrobiaceae bacterium]
MVAPVIEVSHVGKRFWQGKRGAFLALSDVSFDVRDGEFISIIGASGCGKTTLLRMFAGLTAYDSGELKIRGQLVRGVPDGIGFVFQAPALLPWRSVGDNIALGLSAVRSTLSEGELKGRVAAQIELTGLSGFENSLPHELSGGMQQRVGLARALVAEPKVLLMDEPLGALDAFTRMRLQEELAAIVARTGATTVFVTHDVDEAVFLSDRIVVMDRSPGRLKQIVDVPFDKPRQRREFIGDPRVAELRDLVLGLVTADLLLPRQPDASREASGRSLG